MKTNVSGSIKVKTNTDRPTTNACRPGRSITVASIFTPMTKRKNMRPKLPKVSNARFPRWGNNVLAISSFCPKNEGPKMMPPYKQHFPDNLLRIHLGDQIYINLHYQSYRSYI